MDLLRSFFAFLGTVILLLPWTLLLIGDLGVIVIACSMSLREWLEKLSRFGLLVASLIGNLKRDLGESDRDSSSDANLAIFIFRVLFLLFINLRRRWYFPSDKLVFLIKERNSSLYYLARLQCFCKLYLEGVERDDPAIPDLVYRVVDHLANTGTRTDLNEAGLFF